MDKVQIISNYHWRNFLYGYELPESVRQDFDWVEDIDSVDFIFYRGVYYAVADFMAVHNWHDAPFCDWQGYTSDSFFSGVLIRISNDGESYQIATYIS